MNQYVSPPQPPRAPQPQPSPAPSAQRSLALGRDREFLPAAFEILDTPPSPLPVAIMLALCAFCVVALIWAFVGRLDIYAVAWGKLEANGRAKVLQPLDPGRVTALHVENGSRVKAGDMLVELDPTEALADVVAASEALSASRAEVIRRSVAIATARSLRSPSLKSSAAEASAFAAMAFDKAIPPATRARETAVLVADLGQLRDTLANLDKQMAQREATHRRLEASIAYQNALIKTLEGRVDMREQSIKRDVGTRVNLFDARESLQKSQAQLASDNGQLIETDAAADEIASQKAKAISQFLADNETKLADSARKADDIAPQFAKARSKLSHTRLVAPIDGVVQQLAVTTIGQVVTTGQQLLTIAPADAALQVEAYISNADIGFVKAAQDVEIKIDAFPFTRFGVIHGKVLKVATDAIDEQDAKRSLSNALASAGSANAPSSTAPGQQPSFVFPVTIGLERSAIQIDGATMPLSPGMTVTAEIRTDSRRIVDYILSPIARIASEALKER